ncbi:hypothetical protein AVEN_126051-1, partial [Araneus ventricosus]
MRLCYVCRRQITLPSCFTEIKEELPQQPVKGEKVHRNNNSKNTNTANPVFTASPNEESLCRKHLDIGQWSFMSHGQRP